MSTRAFLPLFGLDPGQDIRKTAVAAVREGYAVIPVAAGGKVPLCTLSTAVRQAGSDHPCGVHHAITDPAIAEKVFRRLAGGGTRLNLGVVAGPSRLVVVDAHTAEQVRAFQQDRADAEGDPGLPGAHAHPADPRHARRRRPVAAQGRRPLRLRPARGGVDLGWEVAGTMKADGGYDVFWGMTQTLVPPSVRPEGPYRATGDILDAPGWLIERIQAHIEAKAARRDAHAAREPHDGIAAWSATLAWDQLLGPDGWTATGKPERCGCPVWTKPGGGSTSSKSATAHQDDCPRCDNLEGHGPLHLWTTDPPDELRPYVTSGTQTITKLRYVAATRYGGDEAAAMAGLGIDPLAHHVAGWLNDLPANRDGAAGQSADADPERTSDTSHTAGPGAPGMRVDPGAASDDDAPVPESPALSAPDPLTEQASSPQEHPFWLPHEIDDEPWKDLVVAGAKKAKAAQRARDYLAYREAVYGGTETITTVPRIDLSAQPRPVTPDVAARADGVPLLYRGRVNTVFGPSESGSFLVYPGMRHVGHRRRRVGTVDMEDDHAGFLHRLRTLGASQQQAPTGSPSCGPGAGRVRAGPGPGTGQGPGPARRGLHGRHDRDAGSRRARHRDPLRRGDPQEVGGSRQYRRACGRPLHREAPARRPRPDPARLLGQEAARRRRHLPGRPADAMGAQQRLPHHDHGGQGPPRLGQGRRGLRGADLGMGPHGAADAAARVARARRRPDRPERTTHVRRGPRHLAHRPAR